MLAAKCINLQVSLETSRKKDRLICGSLMPKEKLFFSHLIYIVTTYMLIELSMYHVIKANRIHTVLDAGVLMSA